MTVSSMKSKPGDKVLLISPLTTLMHPTKLTLRYALLGNSSDTAVSLRLHLYTQLKVLVVDKLIATADNVVPSGWESVSACLPDGVYHVVFEATHGLRYVTNIVMDSIETSSQPCTMPFSDFV